MELSLFEHVGELTRSLVPVDLGVVRYRSHRRGVKVWLDADDPPRHHFEAQLVPRRHVDGADGAVVEVGFHAEHKDPDVNVAMLRDLLAVEASWRPGIGDEAEAGAFLGQDEWRRVSEVWLDPDLDLEDPEVAFELAARLADYISHLAPHLPAGRS